MSRPRGWGPPPIVAALGLGVVLWAGTGSSQLTVTLVFIWATIALSWNIIAGYGGQVALGQAAFFGIGAYVSTIIFKLWGVTPLIGIWIGIAASVLAALLIGWPTFRLSGIYFTLATLAYPLIFIPLVGFLGYQEVALPFIRDNAAWYLQFADRRGGSLVALVLLLIAVVTTLLVERSRLGASLLAIRDNQPAAEAAGINTFRTKMVAYAISAAIAGAAGVIYASAVLFVVTSQSVFGLLVSVYAVVIPFIGGTATVWGPIIGAALLIPATEWLIHRYGADLPGLHGVVLGVALILVILFAPNGIYWRMRDLVIGRFPRLGTMGGTRAVPAREVAPTLTDGSVPEANLRVVEAALSDGLSYTSRNDLAGRSAMTVQSDASPILKVDALTRSFGGLVAVNKVTFAVPPGEILGIIGPNGAGKTTLFDAINGFVKPDSGHVFLNDQEITGELPHRICRMGMGRTFQIVRTFSRRTLVENVEVAAFHHADNRAEAREIAISALQRVGLAGREDYQIPSLDTHEIRLMELARALANKPRLLLVDESLSGLSGVHIRSLVGTLRSLREDGLTIVVIEHTMSAMVTLVDRFIVLDHGSVIAEGPPAEVVQNPEVIEAYLGRRWAKHAGDRPSEG